MTVAQPVQKESNGRFLKTQIEEISKCPQSNTRFFKKYDSPDTHLFESISRVVKQGGHKLKSKLRPENVGLLLPGEFLPTRERILKDNIAVAICEKSNHLYSWKDINEEGSELKRKKSSIGNPAVRSVRPKNRVTFSGEDIFYGAWDTNFYRAKCDDILRNEAMVSDQLIDKSKKKLSAKKIELNKKKKSLDTKDSFYFPKFLQHNLHLHPESSKLELVAQSIKQDKHRRDMIKLRDRALEIFQHKQRRKRLEEMSKLKCNEEVIEQILIQPKIEPIYERASSPVSDGSKSEPNGSISESVHSTKSHNLSMLFNKKDMTGLASISSFHQAILDGLKSRRMACEVADNDIKPQNSLDSASDFLNTTPPTEMNITSPISSANELAFVDSLRKSFASLASQVTRKTQKEQKLTLSLSKQMYFNPIMGIIPKPSFVYKNKQNLDVIIRTKPISFKLVKSQYLKEMEGDSIVEKSSINEAGNDIKSLASYTSAESSFSVSRVSGVSTSSDEKFDKTVIIPQFSRSNTSYVLFETDEISYVLYEIVDSVCEIEQTDDVFYTELHKKSFLCSPLNKKARKSVTIKEDFLEKKGKNKGLKRKKSSISLNPKIKIAKITAESPQIVPSPISNCNNSRYQVACGIASRNSLVMSRAGSSHVSIKPNFISVQPGFA